MIVAGIELDLELDATEKRRRGVEHESVATRLERFSEASTPVGVGRRARDLLDAVE